MNETQDSRYRYLMKFNMAEAIITFMSYEAEILHTN